MSEPLVVYVPFPMLVPFVDHERLARIAGDVEVVTTPFEVEHDLRTAREQDPFSEELRARAPELSDDQRDAFARAHVIFTLDVPMLTTFGREMLYPTTFEATCQGNTYSFVFSGFVGVS